ncbi:MAG: AmmeMemoRadiSam system radical SAM enzyme [Chloroflexota bacterium]|nr:AmmeMemoRadiSam system radical SAM enzyme [Chloroflexota bacterium]
MLYPTKLVRQLPEQTVQCHICEHYCTLAPGEWGQCGVHVNLEGTLYLTVYGEAVAAHIDPIEKKPLFHFLPAAEAFSIGTYGCNFDCRWCQNWQISQVRQRQPTENLGERFSPAQIVQFCQQKGLEAIAYTYNEPTVFFAYSYDTAKLAHEHGIKNVYVSNGFMTIDALERIAPYLDGINVDLKGFTEELYRDYCGARLAPIKRNIAYLVQETSVWTEVTTLVIPELNDSDAELRNVAEWLVSVDPHIPWHVTAFYPAYRLRDRPRTPPATLERAYDIGKEAGLEYVYVGNIPDATRENTYCPMCGTLLIKRAGYLTRTQWEEPGTCPQCGTLIPGVWRN